MFIDLDRESRIVGLEINTSKTKAMTKNEKTLLLLNNKPIKFVKEYTTYLGQRISTTYIMAKKIDRYKIKNA